MPNKTENKSIKEILGMHNNLVVFYRKGWIFIKITLLIMELRVAWDWDSLLRLPWELRAFS